MESMRPAILVIEDEEGPRESLKQILQNQYDVYTSANGQEAMTLLKEIPFDLITLDLKLPGTPGQQLISDLRRASPQTDLVIISGSGTLESAISGIRNGVSDFITKPFGVMEVLSSVKRTLEKQAQKRSALEGLPLPAAHGSRTDILEFARVLAATLCGQDRYTHGHCERVVQYSLACAEEFGLTPDECTDLMIAAYLHDIGKVGIDRDIIRKEGTLTVSEQIILRSHPVRGLRMVAPLTLSPLASAVIRSHHECWDGSGYPDGLMGEEIHIAARIVKVADCYDAMTSDRPYRRALSRERAIAELRDGCFKQFDPDVVEVFLSKLNR